MSDHTLSPTETISGPIEAPGLQDALQDGPDVFGAVDWQGRRINGDIGAER